LIEQNLFESIHKDREETEKIKKLNFILENSLIQKENIIKGLKRRIEKLMENKEDIDKEVYVVDPTFSVNAIHDELLLYKQIYESLSNNIIELRSTIDRNKSTIHVNKIYIFLLVLIFLINYLIVFFTYLSDPSIRKF
jgi:hypothetical protein